MFCLKYVFRNEKYVFLNEGQMGICTEDVSAFGQHRKFPPHARKTSVAQGRVFAAQMGICCEVKFSR